MQLVILPGSGGPFTHLAEVTSAQASSKVMAAIGRMWVRSGLGMFEPVGPLTEQAREAGIERTVVAGFVQLDEDGAPTKFLVNHVLCTRIAPGQVVRPGLLARAWAWLRGRR